MKQNAIEMVIEVEDKTEVERFLSILNLGLCVALEQGTLSIEAAEQYLYSPYTLEKLQQLGVSPELLQVVHLGTELEDVESLLTEKLDESLAEMKELSFKILQTLPASDAEQQWIQTQPLPNSLESSANGKPIATQPSKVYVAAHP